MWPTAINGQKKKEEWQAEQSIPLAKSRMNDYNAIG
jgi:hypothetical protein